MRLLNVNTFAFREFFDADIPGYAILSHTWSKEEVTFADWTGSTISNNSHGGYQIPSRPELFVTGPAASLAGLEKVLGWCSKACEEGFEWVWIDTCCIDKSSSAELSEAINSMFRWYADALLCYAFLSDVTSSEDLHGQGSSFRSSRWFTRGWTLQELIAPSEVVFLASDWKEIGTRNLLTQTLYDITQIDKDALHDPQAREDCCYAQRMSWASRRVTSRIEDQAYCLLGLFNVNMPLIYGEGHNAFLRLQQTILDGSRDLTLLSWRPPRDPKLPLEPELQCSGLLARSPTYFWESGKFQALRDWPNDDNYVRASRLTLELTAPLYGPLDHDGTRTPDSVSLLSSDLSDHLDRQNSLFYDLSNDDPRRLAARGDLGLLRERGSHSHTPTHVPEVFVLLVARTWRICPKAETSDCLQQLIVGILLIRGTPFKRLEHWQVIGLDLNQLNCHQCQRSERDEELWKRWRNWPVTKLQAATTSNSLDSRPASPYTPGVQLAKPPLILKTPMGFAIRKWQQCIKRSSFYGPPVPSRLVGRDFEFVEFSNDPGTLKFVIGLRLSGRLRVFVQNEEFDYRVLDEAEISLLVKGVTLFSLGDGKCVVLKRRRGPKNDLYYITVENLAANS